MLTLAIETSGPSGSVAVVDAGKVLSEEALELGKQHGQVLIPAIGRILAECRLAPRDIELVAVSVGPGSFTGLRVGVVCAKTFAYVTGCRLAAVDTLRAIACNCPSDVADVEVICDAHRGDLAVGRFARAGEAWEPARPVEIVKTADWLARLDSRAVVTGPALEKLAAQVEQRCRVLPPETRVPRPIWIAHLGALAFAAGQLENPISLQPIYLRRSSAELQWERLHP